MTFVSRCRLGPFVRPGLGGLCGSGVQGGETWDPTGLTSFAGLKDQGNRPRWVVFRGTTCTKHSCHKTQQVNRHRKVVVARSVGESPEKYALATVTWPSMRDYCKNHSKSIVCFPPCIISSATHRQSTPDTYFSFANARSAPIVYVVDAVSFTLLNPGLIKTFPASRDKHLSDHAMRTIANPSLVPLRSHSP